MDKKAGKIKDKMADGKKRIKGGKGKYGGGNKRRNDGWMEGFKNRTLITLKIKCTYS